MGAKRFYHEFYLIVVCYDIDILTVCGFFYQFFNLLVCAYLPGKNDYCAAKIISCRIPGRITVKNNNDLIFCASGEVSCPDKSQNRRRRQGFFTGAAELRMVE